MSGYTPPNLDPFFIPKPDPSRSYRWISTDAKRLSQWLRSYGSIPGYELVQGKTVDETRALAKSLGLSAHDVSTTFNWISYGDLVLASIPIEEFERRRQEFADMVRADGDGMLDQYYEAATRKGIKPFVKEVEEIEDRKKRAAAEYHDRVGYTGNRAARG